MEEREHQILLEINRALLDPEVKQRIDEIADRVERKFVDSAEPLAWETVPLEVYGNRLPSMIRSSWVFLLRAGAASGAERHPNSKQRVRSWRGSGDFQVWSREGWQSHFLQNDFDVPLDQQWASIEVNVWHQAVVPPGGHWLVVSFHTVIADELMEETPDPENVNLMRQRVYARENV
jgi:hypothetical protein